MFPTTDQGTEMQLKILCLLYFGQYCLHLNFNPYFSSEIHYRKYEKLSNIELYLLCMFKYCRKKILRWKSVPRKHDCLCLHSFLWNRLTILQSLSNLGGLEVTHQAAVPEVPGSIPSSVHEFYAFEFQRERETFFVLIDPRQNASSGSVVSHNLAHVRKKSVAVHRLVLASSGTLVSGLTAVIQPIQRLFKQIACVWREFRPVWKLSVGLGHILWQALFTCTPKDYIILYSRNLFKGTPLRSGHMWHAKKN